MLSRTETAQVLAALGNPVRLALVEKLSQAETFAGLSITELAENSGLTRQAVTKHLEVLADAGLLKRLRPGRATWYELNVKPILTAIEALTCIASQQQRTQQKLNRIHREFKTGAG